VSIIKYNNPSTIDIIPKYVIFFLAMCFGKSSEYSILAAQNLYIFSGNSLTYYNPANVIRQCWNQLTGTYLATTCPGSSSPYTVACMNSITNGVYTSSCASSCTAGTSGTTTVTCCYYNNCNKVTATTSSCVSRYLLLNHKHAMMLLIILYSLFLH
jgi:hypothetical protein